MKFRILLALILLLVNTAPAHAGLGFNMKPAPKDALYVITASDSRLPNATVLNLSAVPAASAAAHTFYGNNTGLTAAPGFSLLTASDIPNIAESQVTNLTTDLGNKQALDATLTALAALDGTAGFIVVTGSDTLTRRSMVSADSSIVVTNPAGTAGNTDFAVGNHAASLITSGTLPIARGGTANGSLGVSALGIYAGDGSQITQITGTASQQFRVNAGGTAIEAFTPSSGGGGFGGSGSDGATTIGANTTKSNGYQYNASSFTVTNGFTLTGQDGELIINSTGAVTINGAIAMAVSTYTNGGLAGGTANSGTSGGSGGGVGGGVPFTAGGGPGGSSAYWGGGYGGAAATSHLQAAPRTNNYGRSGGGAGGGTASLAATNLAGVGGSGNFPLKICAVGAVSLSATGTITGSGTNGQAGQSATTNAASAGGGGGAGSNVIIASQTSITTNASGTITMVGGNGGAAFANGTGIHGGSGGGASGTLLLWSPSTTNSATCTMTGGTAGAAVSTGAAGGAGATGTPLSISGSPNLPLLTWVNENPEKLAPVFALSKNIDNRTVASFAAGGDAVKYCQMITERAMFSSQEPTATAPYCIDLDSEVLKNAS